MAALPKLLTFSLLFIAVSTTASAHNITEILAGNPDYTQFNSLLTQTKLADEINSRQTITVLALSNSAMSSLSSKNLPLSAIKNELSLHVLLDYYDPTKLHSISNGTVLTTTLYQTTGSAQGQIGFVNITDLKGGSVGFGLGSPGSKLDSTYTKSVKQIPYNISVIEISAPIIAPAILSAAAPSAATGNVTALLEKAGCKTFASLIQNSGVLKVYKSQMDKGLTIFAPTDEAFKAKGVPNLSKLTNAELVSLLQYHALNSYTPIGALKTTKGSIPTLATSGTGKYDLGVSTAGDQVTLQTGVDSSRIASTVLDSTPVAIFTVDSLLLPQELFGKSPSPAPAMKSPAPSPAPLASSPAPISASPMMTPMSSPPAPPMETPEGAPAEAPGAKSENASADKGAGERSGPALFTVVFLSVAASSVISVVL